jgi:hypothetical protein
MRVFEEASDNWQLSVTEIEKIVLRQVDGKGLVDQIKLDISKSAALPSDTQDYYKFDRIWGVMADIIDRRVDIMAQADAIRAEMDIESDGKRNTAAASVKNDTVTESSTTTCNGCGRKGHGTVPVHKRLTTLARHWQEKWNKGP